MSSFEDHLWSHLVAEHGADVVRAKQPASRRRSRPLALTASAATVAAALAATLLLTATTNTPPAYALTQNADGTVTVTLNDIATGIPALNAEFAKLGIRETAVPIVAGCTAKGAFEPVDAGSADMSAPQTVGNQWIPAGYNGFLAAKQTAPGHVAIAIGTMRGPIPSCFPDVTATSYPPPTTG